MLDIKLKSLNRKSGVFTLLLANYIIFTVLLAVILSLLFILFLHRATNKMIYREPENIRSYDEIFANGRYDKIPTNQLLGENGFIVILDEKNKVKYNKSDLNINLTLQELSFLPECINPKKLSVEELVTNLGSINYQLTFTYESKNSC